MLVHKSPDKTSFDRYPGPGEGPALEAYLSAADALRDDASFSHVTDPALQEGGPAAPAMLVLKSFDEPEASYDGGWEDGAAVRAWLERVLTPLLPELDQ